MKSIKKFFKDKEWALIVEVLENKRKSTDGTTIKWITLAEKFNIRANYSKKQKRVAANDIWRRFLRHVNKNNLDLVTVKQTLNGEGEILFETKKKLPESIKYSTKGMIVDKVTTNPNGGEWITYKTKNIEEKVEEENIIVNTLDILFNKYTSPNFREDFSFTKQLSLIKEGEFESNRKTLAVVNLYDAHLDKLPIKSTCGVESTLENNIEVFLKTVDKIIANIIQYNVKEVLFPVGNDLFHTNGMNALTKKGTQIELYVSPEDSYYAICDAITEAILRLALVVPKVKILMIKGNHDEDKITTLGFWLDRLFKDSNVEVDYLRKQRKYIKFGKNLLGFAHGDKEKSKIVQLPLIMAQEAKELWGTTTYRKMYLGDLHHGFEYQFLKAKDMPGVEVEYLRSVGTTDTWHEDFGWIGVPKTAYLQIIDSEEGETNRMKFNIK